MEPLSWKFLLFAGKKDGARLAELKRLKAYNKGTRMLAWLAVLMVVPAFILPFTAPFIGPDNFLLLLVIYILALIAAAIVGLALEVCLDAILALKHERGVTFAKVLKYSFDYARTHAREAVTYMGVKLLADLVLASTVILLFTPAMLVLIGLLVYLIYAVPAGDPNVGPFSLLGLAVVVVFAALAALAVALTSKPIAAFYGYYTEEAVRRMGVGKSG